MGYRLLADLTLILHLCFILFVLFGGLLCLHRIYWVWLHIPAATWGVWVEWSGRVCPLTPLENHFRQLASGQGYHTGFIEHYLLPIIYPAELNVSIQVLLGIFVVTVNLFVYLFVIHHVRKSFKRVDE